MQLLDQQYFTPFYGCRKLTFWLKDLGFKVNRKRVRRLMQIINWQTIYREPKTTMSKKNIRNTLFTQRFED
jgi:putative transposase